MSIDPAHPNPNADPQRPSSSTAVQGTPIDAEPVQEWAWAKPGNAPVQWVETEPLEYHQLLRGVSKYRWWKPLVTLILAGFYYLTLSVVFAAMVMIPVMLMSGGELNEDTLLSLAVPDTQQPISLVLTLGSVALMIPAVWLAMLSTGLRPTGRAWSVALRIRWRLVFRTLVPAIAALVVMNVVGITAEMMFAQLGDAPANPPAAPFIDPVIALWALGIVLLLVPVQAAAEELVFRGLFMQVLGAWFSNRMANKLGAFLRGPWIPIVVPSIIFGFAHIYDVWGWLAVVILALVAGWVSWRTGGLEAAITIHVVNNWVAFGLMVFAVGGETKQTASGAGPGSLIGEIVGLALYVWWVERVFVRGGGPRTRIDVVQAASNPLPA